MDRKAKNAAAVEPASTIEDLIERARKLPHNDAHVEAQRRSFAYGNAKIENDRVTRELVDRVADENPRR